MTFHSIQFKLQMKFHVSEWVSHSFRLPAFLSFSLSLCVLCSALLLAWSNSIQFNSIQFNSIQFNYLQEEIRWHSIPFNLNCKWNSMWVSESLSHSFRLPAFLSFFLSLSLCPLLCSLACLIQFNSIQFNSFIIYKKKLDDIPFHSI